MQSYVINIYRCGDETSRDQIVGTFEEPVCGKATPFHSLAELHRLIDDAVLPSTGRKAPPRRRKS